MLEIKKLSKCYLKKEFKEKALNNINLSFNKNEFVFILGPSGAGKSTLLNIIAGLDRKYDGKVIVNNMDLSKLKSNDMDYYRNNYIGFIISSKILYIFIHYLHTSFLLILDLFYCFL